MKHSEEIKDLGFNIESESLTDKAKEEISAFIENYKTKAKTTPDKLSVQKNAKKVADRATV